MRAFTKITIDKKKAKNQFTKNINKEMTLATSQNNKFMRIKSTNNNLISNRKKVSAKIIY